MTAYFLTEDGRRALRGEVMRQLWSVSVIWALAMAIVHAGLMAAASFIIWGAPPFWPGDWHWGYRTLYLIWALLAWSAAVKVEAE